MFNDYKGERIIIISQEMVDSFLGKIKNNFPNFVAGILTDEHGFPIASKIPKNANIKEDHLALSAISESDFIDFSKYQKVVKEIGKKEKVKLLVILEKSARYLHKFKDFNNIIKKQSPF